MFVQEQNIYSYHNHLIDRSVSIDLSFLSFRGIPVAVIHLHIIAV